MRGREEVRWIKAPSEAQKVVWCLDGILLLLLLLFLRIDVVKGVWW